MIDSLAAWCVTYLLHSTFLIGAVWVTARWVRSLSARDTLWKLALCGGIVTATLQSAVPLDLLVPRAAPSRITFDRSDLERVVPALDVPAPVRSSGSKSEVASAAPSLGTTLALIWSVIALALVLRIVIGHRRFIAAVGPRTELLSGPARESLDRLCARADLRRHVRLTQSAALTSPVAMLAWEIVIPATGFERFSEAQRDTILAHELAHLKRRDPLWLTLGELIRALLFFQPLNTLVLRQSKETAEFLCDDAAVLQTGQPKALAESLAELAAHSVSAPPAVAAMAEGGSRLMARVKRVLQSQPVAPLRLDVRLAIAFAVVAVMSLFAPSMVAKVVRASSTATANYVSDAELSQTFYGPEGRTNVSIDAHEAEIAKDGSYVLLKKKSGFVRATQTSERGPKREIEIVGDGAGEPEYRYTVDGESKEWCDDARLVLVAAFGPDRAYPGAGPKYNPQASKPRRELTLDELLPRSVTKKAGWSGWKAWIELTGTDDDVPTYLSIKSNGIRVNYTTGEFELKPGAHLDVVEKRGTVERTFHLDERDRTYDGAFENDENREWLASILRSNSSLPDNVIESLVR